VLNESIDNITVINSCNNKLPFVISIPHSGLYITKEMNDELNDDVILSNSDWYLKELYSFLEEFGFTVIINNISRYVIDPNRELDLTNRDNYANSLIYMKTTFSKDIYKIIPNEEEIKDRINKYYLTYHDELQKQIDYKLNSFDKVTLIDLHSYGKNIEADVVLGDDNHNTMNKKTFNMIKELFVNNGFTVKDNDPYKGGYITRKYGMNNSRCESIQIELSYKKYIGNRDFDEEELPVIDKKAMNNCEKRLKKVFSLLLKN
jgi:N-formylglutamate deformylase/formiminoglutamase